MYLGDIRLGSTLDFKFTSRAFATGIPTTLAGTPSLAAYVDNGTTEITAGITLSVDFDSVTGLNNVRVVASGGNGFTTATNVDIVIAAGTVSGVSVVGEVVGSFSIEARSALMPTTAARTLDVSATGGGGLDLNNIELPVGPIPALGIIENGLLQSATSSSIIVFRAGTTLADDVINNSVVEVIAGTGIGQTRLLVDFTGATDTGTVDPAFSVTLDNTSHVIIRAAPPAPTGTGHVPPVNVVLVDGVVTGEIHGAAATGTLSTTAATSNLTGYANDQLIGRVIIWLSGDCEGEATDITDYASASGLLTFTALTTAPGNGDLFKVV